MRKVNCKGCGKGFMVNGAEYGNMGIINRGVRLYCSDECKDMRRREKSREKMKAWRSTEDGKAAVRRYNLRYKRSEVEVRCLICGVGFKTARKSRKYCDKEECQSKANWHSTGRSREKRRQHYAELDKAGKSARRYMKRMGIEVKCEVCGHRQVQLHHHNYEKRRDVIPLCPEHHKEMHSWDSAGRYNGN